MEWDDEKCLNLIDIYQNTPILWNPKDKNYYKKPLKEDAWDEIGGAMNTSGANCKQKMVNLLASYRREKMKIKKSRKTGTGTDDVYDSKWFAFNALEFLKDRDKPRKGLTTESIADNNAESTEDDNADVPTNEPHTKKSKTDGKLQLLKEAFGILKSAANRPPPQSDNQNPELRSFCDFIIQKMKNYSSHTKNAVQQDICQIIFRADQGFYDCPQQFGYIPQPSSLSASTSSTQAPSTVTHSSVGYTIPSPAIPSTTQADLRNTDSEAFSPMSDYSELDITELI